MTCIEKDAWNAFQLIVNEFLGKTRSQEYQQLVKDLIEKYVKLGCRVSIKLHYLHSHLDFFKPNLLAEWSNARIIDLEVAGSNLAFEEVFSIKK